MYHYDVVIVLFHKLAAVCYHCYDVQFGAQNILLYPNHHVGASMLYTASFSCKT